MNSDKLCQTCCSTRIADVIAKCADRCNYDFGEFESDGYVPYDVGIGGGDYIDFAYCLDCGQIQGTFPVGDPDEE